MQVHTRVNKLLASEILANLNELLQQKHLNYKQIKHQFSLKTQSDPVKILKMLPATEWLKPKWSSRFQKAVRSFPGKPEVIL